MEKEYPIQEGQVEMLDYWRLVKANWVIVVAVFLVILVATALFNRISPRIYEATTRIKVEGERATYAVWDLTRSSEQSFLQNQTAIILSQRILYPVIEELNLCKEWTKPESSFDFTVAFREKVTKRLLRLVGMNRVDNPQRAPIGIDDAFHRLRGRLNVKRIGGSNIIDITVAETNEELAAKIANAVARVYEEQQIAAKREVMSKGIEKLRDELLQQQARLQTAQEKLDKLRKELNLPVFRGTRLDDMAIQKMEQEITLARTEVVVQEARLKELQKLTSVQKRNAIANIITDPNLQKLHQEMMDTELQLEVLKQGYGPDHPSVKEATATVAKLQEQLDSRMDGVMKSFEVDHKMAQAKVQQLERSLTEAKAVAAVVEDATHLPYRNAVREEESERSVYEAVKSRLQRETVELEAARSPVEVIDLARDPGYAVRPNKERNLLFGAVVGLALGVGIVLFLEFLNTSIKKVEDVEKFFELPVLGVIPRKMGVISQGDASLRHIESYRMLRANIEFAKADNSIKSICVLSAGAGEGKSLTTANLATVWAQLGMRVLVVDCDLHRPSIHTYLGVTNNMGLSDFLSSDKSLDQLIQQTDVPGLWLIPSGTGSGSDGTTLLPALTPHKMRELVERANKQYDIVLYDTPPILAVSDAAVVTREVGTAVLVMQFRRYPRNMERRALKVVAAAGGKLLGVVVNNVSVNTADMDYYYQSDYSAYKGAKEHRSAAISQGKAALGERVG